MDVEIRLNLSVKLMLLPLLLAAIAIAIEFLSPPDWELGVNWLLKIYGNGKARGTDYQSVLISNRWKKN